MATRISTSLAALLAAQTIQPGTTLLAAPVLLAGLDQLAGVTLLPLAAFGADSLIAQIAQMLGL
jgi:hypothetical protein